jgi:antitoxin HicB
MAVATYPVVLEQDDNKTVLVSFPDFPEAHTFADTKEEALARAVDALETVIDAYIKDRRAIPAPSRIAGASVELPALVDAKVQLYGAMSAQHVGKAELARRLNVHLPQVDRLLAMKHGSQVSQLEAAAKALGGKLELRLTGIVPHRLSAASRKKIRERMQHARARRSPAHVGVAASGSGRKR